jgi:hypothetical protein
MSNLDWTKTVDLLTYSPGLQDSTDLESATKTISATLQT